MSWLLVQTDCSNLHREFIHTHMHTRSFTRLFTHTFKHKIHIHISTHRCWISRVMCLLGGGLGIPWKQYFFQYTKEAVSHLQSIE